MGEKKMIKKEIKSPSKKKAEPPAVVPSRNMIKCIIRSYSMHISCPSFSSNFEKFFTIWRNTSGSGVITKSWISSRCTHQIWPQLVETNISPKDISNCISNYDRVHYCRELKNIPLRMSVGSKRGNRVLITGISFPAFVFDDRRYYCKWTTRDCRITDPYSCCDSYMEFTNVIRLNEKIYAISRQGSLALIEYDDDSVSYEITALGRSRVVPYCQVSKNFREYLLKYEGEIYVVFLLSRFSINVVDNVEVLRLDKSRLLFEKVDRLVGDAMFFVQDNRSMGISASLLGCSKGSNCVYFTHDKANGSWFVYDMISGCISTTPGPEIDL
ncbi:hypothetical protein CASFOL_019946 [Castilleja foliolosa]|uniref:KIB1-4 beta-propeller domain-containing protein n=1 Tax=Castilleja foliolosa TaxID=1961234 RepID=A0ABD3D0R7_9LAMI